MTSRYPTIPDVKGLCTSLGLLARFASSLRVLSITFHRWGWFPRLRLLACFFTAICHHVLSQSEARVNYNSAKWFNRNLISSKLFIYLTTSLGLVSSAGVAARENQRFKDLYSKQICICREFWQNLIKILAPNRIFHDYIITLAWGHYLCPSFHFQNLNPFLIN